MDPFDTFRPQAWTRDAACRDLGAGGDAFFSDHRGEQYADARKICARCPLAVQRQCLQFAIDNNEEGFWAGTTKPERAALAKGESPLTPTQRRNAQMLDLFEKGATVAQLAVQFGVTHAVASTGIRRARSVRAAVAA